MNDWLKAKGLPLFLLVLGIWTLWDGVNWFLEVRDYYFSFSTAITGIYLGAFQVIIAITLYFESNKKSALGQIISVIFGVLMLISWQLVMNRYVEIIQTFDNVMVLIMSVSAIIVGIIKLIKLSRGESIQFSKKTQIIVSGIFIFIMIAIIIFIKLMFFGIFG